ncbi:hypothetical protein A3D66_02075 [Candidatus Kaiserbacteria bacterium RIFCSPHIGHO2_02_FULL_50_9]|nr:MAG: hypothetical protein A2761_02855 [Candidatus Kaiserbacteria bacterium RIFCSPHIGHO2_01_FULL_51_33]OGG63393.1 MAG: hypothetical protein A3D66_02075 [Candidatus Kaiserbacteria bacterium RIFCSPHIGHO2_02_FULL_50_9]
MSWKFPARSDYPNSLSLLDNPSQNPEGYVQIFTSSASAYFETDPLTRSIFMRRFYLIDDYLQKNTPEGKFDRALDAGTGIGFALPLLATYAKHVTALDFSPVSLSYAKEMVKQRNLPVECVEGDLTKMPFPDGSFDLLVCMSVLEHFANPSITVAELRRTVKRGGVLIVGYPTETPFFHFLHETVSRLVPRRRKINQVLAETAVNERYSVPHVSNAKTIGAALSAISVQTRVQQRIHLLPGMLPLYEINFLRLPA